MYFISLKGRVISKGDTIAQAKVNALKGLDLMGLEVHYELIDRTHGLVFKPLDSAPASIKKGGSILFKVCADKEAFNQ